MKPYWDTVATAAALLLAGLFLAGVCVAAARLASLL